MLKKKSFFAIATVVIVLLIGITYFLFKNPTVHEIIIKNELNADNMYETISYLSEQPRAAATDGEWRAVEYIEKEFKRLGYKTEVQPFPIYEWEEKHVSVKINDVELKPDVHAFLGYVNGKVSSPLVNVGKAELRELGFGDHVRGKIALIERDNYFLQIRNVIDCGAVGVIMYNNEPSGGFIGVTEKNVKIPAVSITREQGLELVNQLKVGSIDATLDLQVEQVEKTSHNVIASLKPEKSLDSGKIVTIGAHHDSVPKAPGANDDASGVAAVLELARVFSKASVDTEVRFLTFGAEERGLIGSTYYVSNLPQNEIDRMVGHFQMDMVGAKAAGSNHPAGGLMMYTISGVKNFVTDLGASAAKETINETIPYGKLGRSDHQPFHNKGIPAALFIHAPVEPDYHQPSDTVDKISKEKLYQVAEIVGTAVYKIASQKTPTIDEENAIPASIDYHFENRSLE
jgi:aminopeptidase YwaD